MSRLIHAAAMRRWLAIFCLVVATASAEPTFWQQMTPEERKAAGIDQLTPAQQAALNAAAARYVKEGARQAVEVIKAETTEVVRQAREQAKAEAKAEVRKKKIADAGLAAREDDEVIRTRIVGEFRGWRGSTTFTLANGQVWQQVDKESRFFSKMVDPEVELIPSRWLGWKMRLVSEGLWIRVKRVH